MFRVASRVPAKAPQAAAVAAAVAAAGSGVETANAEARHSEVPARVHTDAWNASLHKTGSEPSLDTSWEDVRFVPGDDGTFGDILAGGPRESSGGKGRGLVGGGIGHKNRGTVVSLAPPTKDEAVAAFADLTALCAEAQPLCGSQHQPLLRSKNHPPPAGVDDISSGSQSLNGSSIFGHVDPDACLEDSERAMEAARMAMWENGQQIHQQQHTLSSPPTSFPPSSLALNACDSHASFNHFLAAFNEAQKNPAISQAIQSLACNENVYNSILSQQELIPLLRAFGATDVQGLPRAQTSSVTEKPVEHDTSKDEKPEKPGISMIAEVAAMVLSKLQSVFNSLSELLARLFPDTPTQANKGDASADQMPSLTTTLSLVVTGVIIVIVAVILKRKI